MGELKISTEREVDLSVAVYYIIPIVLGVLAIGYLVAAVTNFRQSRRAAYFRIRQDASGRAWRQIFIVLAAVAGIVGAILARQVVPAPGQTPSIDPGSFLPGQPTAALLPSRTPLQTSVAANGEMPPTITPTLVATSTPNDLPISTVETTVTPPSSARMMITVISSDISNELTPVNPADTFPVGIPRIYYWLEYANMVDGVSWSQVLLRGDEVIRSESDVWDQGEEGEIYYYFTAQGGWPIGNYEVQFFVGDEQETSATYQVVN